MNIFYPEGPRADMTMSAAEKAARAKRFRLRRTVSDFCVLLVLADALLLWLGWRRSFSTLLFTWPVVLIFPGLMIVGMLVNIIVSPRRCPFCGRLFRRWDHAARLFSWRFFRCPDCDFTPYWDREHETEDM